MTRADLHLAVSQVWLAASFAANEGFDELLCVFVGFVWLALSYYQHRRERG